MAENVITRAESAIGKELKDFTIDDIAQLISDETTKDIPTSLIFLVQLLQVNSDVEIHAAYYPMLVTDKLERSINQVSLPVLKASHDLGIEPTQMSKEFILDNSSNTEALVAISGMLSELRQLASIELDKNTMYTMLGAIVQLSHLSDYDLKSRKRDITEALALVYEELNNINLITGFQVVRLILNSIVDPIERIWVKTFNESIVDENDANYISTMDKLNILIQGIEYEQESKEDAKIVS